VDIAIDFFVALHIIGIAALLGGFLTQMKALRTGEARVVPAMVHGALTMLVTGVVLVGLNDADHHHPNMLKIGIKSAVLIVVLLLVWINRDEEHPQPGVIGAIGGLTTLNIFIATLWT
jgi:predicted exporter